MLDQQKLQRLQNAVQNWESINGSYDHFYSEGRFLQICSSIQYASLFYYYPTNCEFEATEEEWANRWLVWDFKNTPGKTLGPNHERALKCVIPMLSKLLLDTFGHDIKDVVLVCIPASSQQKTELRYKDFSRLLCSQTGMISAYDKMTVKDGNSLGKHNGGVSLSTEDVQFDSDFFKEKFVILFDDVITKGNSMMSFKCKMQSLGATVICGISLGKTKHERPVNPV